MSDGSLKNAANRRKDSSSDTGMTGSDDIGPFDSVSQTGSRKSCITTHTVLTESHK